MSNFPWWRRARQHFGIRAPRMAVRSHLPWPWRAGVAVILIAIVAGMWWLGFDFGQIFGGFNRQEVEAKLAALSEEVSTLRAASTTLKARNTQLESEISMTRGAQATLSRQAVELQNENSQLKEELVFLQKLFADSNKQPGIAIQRLAVERERDDLFHYSLLVVRGGNPKVEFSGQLSLQVVLVPTPGASGPRPTTLTLPDDEPEASASLTLKFKYYQRVEGSFHVPAGHSVRSVTARALETGQTTPRATRTLNLS